MLNDAHQKSILLSLMGKQSIEIYNRIPLTATQRKTLSMKGLSIIINKNPEIK